MTFIFHFLPSNKIFVCREQSSQYESMRLNNRCNVFAIGRFKDRFIWRYVKTHYSLSYLSVRHIWTLIAQFPEVLPNVGEGTKREPAAVP